MISDVLVAGSNIHAVDWRGCTPLSYVIGSMYPTRRAFNRSLLGWLKLLQQAGYDIHEYLCREFEICPTVFAVGGSLAPPQHFYWLNQMVDFWNPHYQSLQRSMDLKICEVTDILMLRFSQERLSIDVEQFELFHHNLRSISQTRLICIQFHSTHRPHTRHHKHMPAMINMPLTITPRLHHLSIEFGTILLSPIKHAMDFMPFLAHMDPSAFIVSHHLND